MGCAHGARKLPLNATGAQGIGVLLLANFHDRGLDDVLDFLLSLFPDHQSFIVRVGGHVCLADSMVLISPVFQWLKVINFLGMPHIPSSHAHRSMRFETGLLT